MWDLNFTYKLLQCFTFSHIKVINLFFYLFVFTYHFQLMVYTLSLMYRPRLHYENFNIYISAELQRLPRAHPQIFHFYLIMKHFYCERNDDVVVPIPSAHYISSIQINLLLWSQLGFEGWKTRFIIYIRLNLFDRKEKRSWWWSTMTNLGYFMMLSLSHSIDEFGEWATRSKLKVSPNE